MPGRFGNDLKKDRQSDTNESIKRDIRKKPDPETGKHSLTKTHRKGGSMASSNESGKGGGTTRRDFLKASTVAASAAVSGALGIGSSVYAAGSNIIRVGMVGCGG